MTEEREHTLSADCWCHPIIDNYGAEYEYNEHGEVVSMKGATVVHEIDDSQRRFLLQPIGMEEIKGVPVESRRRA